MIFSLAHFNFSFLLSVAVMWPFVSYLPVYFTKHFKGLNLAVLFLMTSNLSIAVFKCDQFVVKKLLFSFSG